MPTTDTIPSPIPQEVEAKFRVTAPAQVAGLRTEPLLAGRYPLGALENVENVDTYFDTPDCRLLRQGRTLRVRVDGGSVLMTAKSIGLRTPKGLHTREEVERPAPVLSGGEMQLEPAMLPEEVSAALGDLLREGDTLLPLAQLRQERGKRLLYAPGTKLPTVGIGDPIAELSLDAMTVMRPLDSGWESVAELDELEIELAPGAERSALREVALDVRELAGLEPNDKNKLQQALEAIAAAPVTADVPADHCLHVAELCRRVWREQLAVMMLNEAGVRYSDDIEFVHEMRVATRRARAAGRLYAAFFDPGSKKVARFARHLRTTGRLLGSVRDLDVAIDKLERYAAAQGDPEGEGSDALRSHWRKQRAAAHARLLTWLDSKRYSRFVGDLLRFCESPGEGVPEFAPRPGEAPAPHQVRHVLPSMILNRYESIRAFEVLLEGAAPVPVETLHALRIECKYLRYHLEFSAGLLGAAGEELIAALKALQEHLGDLNDASVGTALLDAAGKHARGALVGSYRALQEETVASLQVRLPADVVAFLAPENRRKLALALAAI